eukprot:660396-Prymnesium_polylepis.1
MSAGRSGPVHEHWTSTARAALRARFGLRAPSHVFGCLRASRALAISAFVGSSSCLVERQVDRRSQQDLWLRPLIQLQALYKRHE